MIDTFLLSKIDLQVKEDYSQLVIRESGENDFVKNLKLAVEWALLNEEDVIYCVCTQHFTAKFDIESLSISLNKILEDDVFVLYIDAEYNSFIPVDKDLLSISEIKNVKSFILLRPIYSLIISLSNNFCDSTKFDLLAFLGHIAPHSFMLNHHFNVNSRNNQIRIISPFRNIEKYVVEYLDSILKQEYQKYDLYLIDDFSTDGGILKVPDLPFIKKRVNSVRRYALTNIVEVLLNNRFDDDDIICLVDADDKLCHRYVLNIINNAYINDNVLLTYGSMLLTENLIKIGTSYSREEFDNLRNMPWKVSHLRTFKYKLFRMLLAVDPNLQCLKDCNGAFFKMPYDMALLFPLMELAGYDSVKFIDTPTYTYRIHDGNDSSENRSEQYLGEIEIRSKQSLRCSL